MVNSLKIVSCSVKRRRKPKAEAGEAAKRLLELSVLEAGKNAELAKEQAALARRVMLRFNVRFGWELRRFYCHGCKKLLVPGMNARVRLTGGRPKTVRLACLECGHVNRKVLE
jgi:RNase P subunit RPR2